MNIRNVDVLTSTNNRIVVETYKKEALKATVSSGFASINQKNNVKGLKVLVEATFPDGLIARKGYTVYIKEELLHTQPWATKSYESEAIEGPFMIVDMAYVEFILP